MDDKEITREYYNNLITDYIDGKKIIKGEHPKEVKEAIDSFFHAGKMLMEYPELEHVPTIYIEKLLKALAKYPQYGELVMELIAILNYEEETKS
tara:strand:- start:1655 stop:1936 length:282 start_codon:yes stop_codon:yes gene_type:complete